MRWRLSFACSAAVLMVLAATGVVLPDTPPRQLIYSFSYSSQQEVTARDSSNIDVGTQDSPVGSHVSTGSSQYVGHLSEIGTMTVNVIREQPDKGLVVTISEQGRGTRSAPAATCVVYANTSVICDPDKTVNPEEYTLLRFLASNFVDPNQLDAKQHWTVSHEGGGVIVNSDYTITHNAGGVMTIGEARSVKQASAKSTTTDVQTKIAYDFGHLRPTSIDEYVTEREENGVTGNTTTIYQTSLQFVSDSAVSKT